MRTKMPRRAAAAFFLLAAGLTASHAQPAWKPEGNVEFVVGAGAGGENDRIARAIQHALLKEHLVDSMTVLNKPGAAQTIAINYLAQKKGDANAIGLASGSFINAIARNGSQLHKQFTPLIKLFDAYQAYFTAVDSPIKSMADVRDRLKADPSRLTFAFPVGLGSPLHVSVVNVGKAAGAPAEQARRRGVQLGLRRRRAGRRPSHRRRPDQHRQSLSADPGRQAAHARHRRAGAAAGELAQYPTVREQGLDVVTANSYTVLVPHGLSPSRSSSGARRSTRCSKTRTSRRTSRSTSGCPSRSAIPTR